MDPTDEKEVGRMVGKDVVEEYILQIIGLLYYSNGGPPLRHFKQLQAILGNTAKPPKSVLLPVCYRFANGHF